MDTKNNRGNSCVQSYHVIDLNTCPDTLTGPDLENIQTRPSIYHMGVFNNYVDQILPNLEPLTPSRIKLI